MIVLISRFLKILLPKHIAAITLWPLILFIDQKHTPDQRIINHERIHLRQQIELLVLPFYLIYLLEYLFLLAYYQNHQKAYTNISFEKEAYCHDSNFDYLNTRSFWAMWRLNKPKNDK